MHKANEVVGSELSITPGIAEVVGPLGSSHRVQRITGLVAVKKRPRFVNQEAT
jgi:hypothetical protein